MQNLVIRDYCKKQGLQYLLSATEYAMANSHLILQQVLNELPKLDGIVFYSLFLHYKYFQNHLSYYVLKNLSLKNVHIL